MITDLPSHAIAEKKIDSFLYCFLSMYNVNQLQIFFFQIYSRFFFCFSDHCMCKRFVAIKMTRGETVISVMETCIEPPRKKNFTVCY